MIMVEQAIALMKEAATRLPSEEVPLRNAAGRVLCGAVMAPHDHPLFDMTAVDGYALAESIEGAWMVVGEVAAGEVFGRSVIAGEAVRIFTGAAVPNGTATVVMQEFVHRDGVRIMHTDERLRSGGNIRRRAEQVRKGDKLFGPGTSVGAASIGLLASIGVRAVEVVHQPKVLVVITGNEFSNSAEPAPGRIFSSNDVMLETLLSRATSKVELSYAPDNAVELKQILEQGLATHDVVITTGGVSVGDHDLVADTVQALGAEVVFHGVQQKPGKPMLFAKRGTKAIIGLPGNPRAVMVLCAVYVLPFLRAMQGCEWSAAEELPLATDVSTRGERAEFRAATVQNGRVELLADEGSHMLRSLVDADALAYLPQGRTKWSTGDHVQLYPITKWDH